MPGNADAKDGFNSLIAGSTDSSTIEVYYDEWAETYNQTLQEWSYQTPADAAAILAAHLKPNAQVLDVGCGTGMFASALSQHLDCRVEGIDISAASLEIASKQGNYEHLHRVDLQSSPLPFGENTFDGAACVGVLTYIEDAARLLEDLCRIVRPSGHIVFTQRNDRWIENDFDTLINNFAARGLWTPVLVSAPKPYLPKNEEFGDSIKVIHVLCCIH